MRRLPARDVWLADGCEAGERFGAETLLRAGDRKAEYLRVREAVGLLDASHVQKFTVPEAAGVDFLDSLVAGNAARTRFGRVLHTFMADDAGMLVADCYVANNDDKFVLLCESIVGEREFRQALVERGGAQAGLADLTESHALFSMDGYKAWAVARDLFGADVLGLPYLSIEHYPHGGTDITLIRAGKTSEFGYLIMAPAAAAPALAAELRDLAAKHGGGWCGLEAHGDLRLDGRFFNIYAEGAAVRDPLELGLQWMVDFDKADFRGAAAIKARRAAGVARKIAGVRAEPGVRIEVGMSVFDGESVVGTVVASCFSHALGAPLALALLKADLAYAGLEFRLGTADGPALRTVSMPPIIPKSLSVKLDEL